MVCYGVIQKTKTKNSHIKCAVCNDFTPVRSNSPPDLFTLDNRFLGVEDENRGLMLRMKIEALCCFVF